MQICHSLTWLILSYSLRTAWQTAKMIQKKNYPLKNIFASTEMPEDSYLSTFFVISTWSNRLVYDNLQYLYQMTMWHIHTLILIKGW